MIIYSHSIVITKTDSHTMITSDRELGSLGYLTASILHKTCRTYISYSKSVQFPIFLFIKMSPPIIHDEKQSQLRVACVVGVIGEETRRALFRIPLFAYLNSPFTPAT